eukprot:NODE_1824_length_545_cov_240.196682_g1810_i0.p1 GENE.NODE_1824_length_545_cov_240.196682_g1810_i0~~NODE_1824_length_545_cov_240.196682_g1810_i0.p1  ORF type:complete len:132 (-),score=26.55 NODE_1824_length_545_cov_240.196682_g1810_i0:139-534(-)
MYSALWYQRRVHGESPELRDSILDLLLLVSRRQGARIVRAGFIIPLLDIMKKATHIMPQATNVHQILETENLQKKIALILSNVVSTGCSVMRGFAEDIVGIGMCIRNPEVLQMFEGVCFAVVSQRPTTHTV